MVCRLDIRRAYHADLFYHCLAHVNMGDDAASLHSPRYCAEMRQARPPGAGDGKWLELSHALVRIEHGYWFTFLPFFAPRLEEMRELLAAMARGGAHCLDHRQVAGLGAMLVSPEAPAFAEAFREAMDEEERFYGPFWRSREAPFEESTHAFERFLLEEGGSFLDAVADRLGAATVALWLVPAVAGGGRAISLEGKGLHVAVGLPATRDERFDAFFQCVHEMTHFITNEKVIEALGDVPWDTKTQSEGFDTHRKLEEAAHAFDYRLFSKGPERFRLGYITWARRFFF